MLNAIPTTVRILRFTADLTLLALKLLIKPPSRWNRTIYWHFRSKEIRRAKKRSDR